MPLIRLVEDAGYQTLAPAYAPFRTQFLESVKLLAEGMRPLVQSVASLPGAGCLAALQSALLSVASPRS